MSNPAPANLPHPSRPADIEWAAIAAAAPQLANTMCRYLAQAGTFLAPRSVDSADNALRLLGRFLRAAHPEVHTVADIRRPLIEEFKVWLAAQPGTKGQLVANTQRQRLRMLRMFFERIIEWEWDDSPPRNPIIGRDIPPRPEPLPRFLDDPAAAKLMRAAAAHPDLRHRLVVEILARTGLRASELCDLEADSVVVIGDAHWLRVPVGKLRNDRFIPLHPQLVALLNAWTADNLDHIRRHHRLLADPSGPLDRHQVGRMVNRVAKQAGIGHVHPHQLRHTLATQAINRGMRLEAIALLLGHRSMEMTLTYARITDRVVADEYAAVSAKVDALYNQPLLLPADAETLPMSRLRKEAFARMLGNGLCTRPAELECRMESACETCSYFQTTSEFKPVLLRQRDHARDHNQPDRAQLFDNLLSRLDQHTP